jgi:dTMP kinase
MKKRGMFIVFEGGEGSGKSTLMANLYEHLMKSGKAVVLTREPGGSPLGDAIRQLLLQREKALSIAPMAELLLFLAARAQHLEELIRPSLKQGKIVLCDRFNDSTLAYQGGARGFDEKFIWELCSFACHNVHPHLTIYLDIDPKLGLERVTKTGVAKDRIESEDIHFHQEIRNTYHKIAKNEPKRVRLVDASRTPEEVHHQVMKLIDAYL